MNCIRNSKKTRSMLLTVVFALGVVSIVFGLVGARLTPEDQHATIRLMGMLTGMGTGIVLVAAIATIRARVVKPEKLEQERIEAEDERNVALTQRAMYIAALAAMGVLVALAFVFTGLGYSLPGLLCVAGLYVEAASFIVARAVLRRRM